VYTKIISLCTSCDLTAGVAGPLSSSFSLLASCAHLFLVFSAHIAASLSPAALSLMSVASQTQSAASEIRDGWRLARPQSKLSNDSSSTAQATPIVATAAPTFLWQPASPADQYTSSESVLARAADYFVLHCFASRRSRNVWI
jgi:hypothetical protein